MIKQCEQRNKTNDEREREKRHSACKKKEKRTIIALGAPKKHVTGLRGRLADILTRTNEQHVPDQPRAVVCKISFIYYFLLSVFSLPYVS